MNQDIINSEGEATDTKSIGDKIASMNNTGMSKSPYNNFTRATTGQKLYYNDDRTGPLPPPKIFENTKQQEARQRILYRAANGMPLKKFAKNIEFVPCNPSQAKSKIKANTDTVGLFGDEYDLKKQADKDAAAEKLSLIHI